MSIDNGFRNEFSYVHCGFASQSAIAKTFLNPRRCSWSFRSTSLTSATPNLPRFRGVGDAGVYPLPQPTDASTGTPILGVNLGYLGFLTEVRLAELYPTLESWCSGCHHVDERAMLHAELWRGGQQHSSYEALNEVVVSKGDIARMGEFAVELDGKSVARFRADGVIVSTPTGSTAYSLAANGPILTPDVDATVVTPICPHLLTLRPIVVPGDARLVVRVVGIPNLALLTVDGQQAVELELGDELRCSRSTHKVRLVRFSESGFFEALRSKLSWGEQ